MRKADGGLILSASDLLGYMGCAHHATLGLRDLEEPIQRADDDDQAQLIQEKGDEHEAAYLKMLRRSGQKIAEISDGASLDKRVEQTAEAMRRGVPIVYQATFRSGRLMGHADFLRRVDRPSALGAYSYEVIDTKLARSPKSKFAIQLCFYSRLLTEAQGLEPERAFIVLGTGEELPIRLADYRYYFREVLERFLEHCDKRPETRPEPCAFCDLCPWRDHCNAQWEADDHLAFVAGIQRSQIDKLRAAGVNTLAGLAQLPGDTPIPKLAAATLDKLRNQARLQLESRQDGEPHVERLPLDEAQRRGFYRLPEPSEGDLFFDMEGDPLEPDGLEYLFGVYYREAGKPRFKPFWAHDRQAEREAFEAFMDFVTEHLRRYPQAHIYHYAHYEQTALKRLMSLHGTREAQVDDLLRRGNLIDLYQVVREAIRVSEPRYSIKNLEVFYRGKREGDVKDAGASIVAYEKWRETGEQRLLEEIEDYNRIDCESTYELQQWLLGLRPADLPFRAEDRLSSDESSAEPSAVSELEQRLVAYRHKLGVDGAEVDPVARLSFELLDFHRRNDKPVWWAMFARHEMTDEELLEDVEALAMLQEDPAEPREPEKRSEIVTYGFPDQEFKMRLGDRPLIAATLEPAGEVVDLDPEHRLVRLKRGLDKRGPLPGILSMIPGGPLKQESQRKALFRLADSIAADDGRYAAVESILRQDLPRIRGVPPGRPLIRHDAVTPQAVADLVGELEDSYLFIQGPPGAGKTYTGSYVIVELMRRGHSVGVTSNSHKAIDNLLAGVEKWAEKRDVVFQGYKKASRNNPDSEFDGRFIDNVFSNQDIFDEVGAGAQLIAGTSWLFSPEELDGELDFLFVDEAGQVALANIAAMGTSARNVVLLGDQMQLGQPIQGVHPGRSGESSLEYLLDGHATIAPESGVFLPSTYRMHPRICRFISDAIYDGRLKPAEGNERQRLEVDATVPADLMEPGLVTLDVPSDGYSQQNDEEARAIQQAYQALLGQPYINRDGERHRIAPENILVVAPYNMQVNRLKEVLGEGARVGTVDKFQGQEAEVVFVSMTTSNQDYLPRFLDFLFSRNRLNVAISRARTLAVLVMSPDLTRIECNSLEQMQLVNTLCWARAYSAQG